MYIFLGINEYLPRWIYGFVVLCPRAPEGSVGRLFWLKTSQKRGPWLKVSSDRLGVPVIGLGAPGYKASGFLLHHGGSFDVGISRLIS